MRYLLIAIGTCVSVMATVQNSISQDKNQLCDFSLILCVEPPTSPGGVPPTAPPPAPGGGGIQNLPGAPISKETIIIPNKDVLKSLNLGERDIENLQLKLRENKLQLGR